MLLTKQELLQVTTQLPCKISSWDFGCRTTVEQRADFATLAGAVLGEPERHT